MTSPSITINDKSSSSVPTTSSSQTTSIPDYQSTTTSSSSQRIADMQSLKHELKLIGIQLKQRDVELQRLRLKQHSKDDDQRQQQDDDQLLINRLNTIEQLYHRLQLAFDAMHNQQQMRIADTESHYRMLLDEMSQQYVKAQQTIGRITVEKTRNDTKMVSLIHENAYLNAQFDYAKEQLVVIKAQLIEQQRIASIAQGDLADAQLNQQAIIDANRIDDDEHRQRAHRQSVEQRREVDRLTQMANSRLAYANAEVTRQQEYNNQLTRELQTAIDDNDKLRAQINEMTIADATQRSNIVQLTNENERLRAQIDEQLAMVLVPSDVDRSNNNAAASAIIAALQCRLDQAHSTIRKCNNQIDQLLNIGRLSNMDEMRHQLKLKTRSLIDLQHTIDTMQQQCRYLKEQKDNATLLLVDMSRDMSQLLDEIKNL